MALKKKTTQNEYRTWWWDVVGIEVGHYSKLKSGEKVDQIHFGDHLPQVET